MECDYFHSIIATIIKTLVAAPAPTAAEALVGLSVLRLLNRACSTKDSILHCAFLSTDISQRQPAVSYSYVTFHLHVPYELLSFG